jgi:hypothetical protein
MISVMYHHGVHDSQEHAQTTGKGSITPALQTVGKSHTLLASQTAGKGHTPLAARLYRQQGRVTHLLHHWIVKIFTDCITGPPRLMMMIFTDGLLRSWIVKIFTVG